MPDDSSILSDTSKIARQANVPAVPAPLPPAQLPRAGRRPLRLLALACLGLAVLGAAAYGGYDYWTVGRFIVSTDDAYVVADSTTVAPKVSGYIAAVLVADNEPVIAGQALARIDDRDFAVAAEQARADVEGAHASIAARQAQLEQQQTVIGEARATLTLDQANAAFATQENHRYASLAATGFGSQQRAQQAAARIGAARAAVDRDTAALATAVKQIDLLKAELAAAKAALARDEAVLRQAELNLSYTSITAPIDGTVGNRMLRVGQYVQAGTPLMAVVPIARAYVVANYKETQLSDVRPGQPVEVGIDMFAGTTITGHVDSIAPASGHHLAGGALVRRGTKRHAGQQNLP